VRPYRALLLSLALSAVGCRSFDVADPAADGGADGGAGDGSPASCSVTAWTMSEKMPVVNVGDHGDFAPAVSPDGHEIFFSSWRGGRPEIWRSERIDVTGDFDPPERVFAPLPEGDEDATPRLSQDARLLLGTGMRGGVKHELWIARRQDLVSAFESPMFIENVGSSEWEGSPWLSSDGLRLYFSSGRGGDFDIYLAVRSDPDGLFDQPEPVAALNTDLGETGIALTADELEAYVSSARPGGLGYDLYGFRRSSRDDPFGAAQQSDLLNTGADDLYPFSSLDGTRMYFNAYASWSGGSNNADLWSAVRDCDP
jgi:hypothetical protein